MKKGKQKCDQLKSIRKAFAEANGVEYTPSQCTLSDECNGTCPKCEEEADFIMNKVNKKSSMLDAVSVRSDVMPETKDSEVRIIDVIENPNEINSDGEIMTPGIILDFPEDVIYIEGDSPGDIILEDVLPGNIDYQPDDILVEGDSPDDVILEDVLPENMDYQPDDIYDITDNFVKKNNESRL